MSADYLFLPAQKAAGLRFKTWTCSFFITLFLTVVLTPRFCQAETIQVGTETLSVQLAQTQEEQTRGLQGVAHIGEHQGMLFVFQEPERVCMWMHKVPIDLDVGFFDEDGLLVAISTMKAQTRTTHCAPTAIRFALETRAHWYKDHQIKLGTQLKRIPK
ncbi:MAG TPA: DUF192 domain-containing protein [Candidatus Aphodousia faecipullorum]|nr:DUF192 domain-containing protein [Candidatus Aphodousia faecipullorum]